MHQINNDSFLRQLFKQTEEEKKRIANEIHEKINHELIELKKDFRVDIEDLSSRVDLIIRQIREIYSELHPVLFEDIGLKDSIEHLVATIQFKHDLFITTDIRYNQALTKDEDLQIFRIVQESLLNIVNYTKATAVRINIFVINLEVRIEIKDNGCGLDSDETINQQSTFWLMSIKERSKSMGGKVNIQSGTKGSIISISIPINSKK